MKFLSTGATLKQLQWLIWIAVLLIIFFSYLPEDGLYQPFMVGAAVLLLSTGLGGLRTAVLPKWLAIVTVVLGVCSLGGPTGFLVWFAMPVWCIVTSVVLVRRQSAQTLAPRTTQAVNA